MSIGSGCASMGAMLSCCSSRPSSDPSCPPTQATGGQQDASAPAEEGTPPAAAPPASVAKNKRMLAYMKRRSGDGKPGMPPAQPLLPPTPFRNRVR